MPSIWDTYPSNYRASEINALLEAARAGDCAAVVGLSGAGKSNLLGFFVHRIAPAESDVYLRLVDCNRLVEATPGALFQLMRVALDDPEPVADPLSALEARLEALIDHATGTLCLLFDHFDTFIGPHGTGLQGSLRALRDAHKYRLVYVIATRRPLDPVGELAELFYAHTLWLGPLSESDARWSASQYGLRAGKEWDDATLGLISKLSWGYPSLVRGVCEAHAAGSELSVNALLQHPAVRRRVEDFWADEPQAAHLRISGLEGQPLLAAGRGPAVDETRLTAKEHLLLAYLRAHPDKVCSKDDLIQAVWPEDVIYEQGVRDDSLAQLIRRLRLKIEDDPSRPSFIHTVAGRGYLFRPG